MSYVIEIVLKLLDRVFFAVAVGIVDLCPTRDPRLHQMPEMIKRNLLFVALHTLEPLRAWPDQAHVAFEHIPKLRQFVQAELAQQAAEASYPRIVLTRVNIFFCDL